MILTINSYFNFQGELKMSLDVITKVLAWCCVFNIEILIIRIIAFNAAHDLMYQLHNKLFKISADTFHNKNYTAFMVYRLLILVFNLVPYLVLRLFL